MAGAGFVAPDNPFLRLRTRTLIPWMIVGTIAIAVGFAIVSLVSPMDLMDPATGDLAAEVAVYGLLAAWLVWACRNSGADLPRLIGRVPAGYNWLPAAGLLATALMFSIGSWYVTAYSLSRLAPGMLESLMAMEQPVGDSIASHVLSAVVVVVIAPVTEEVLFRGVLISRWGVKWGVRTGIVAAAVVFGVCHLINTAGATALGLITALLYFQSRTLIVPIAFHAANNLVATLAEFAVGSEEPSTLVVELQEIEAMVLPGLAMVALTLPVLVWYIRRNWPARDAVLPYMEVA